MLPLSKHPSGVDFGQGGDFLFAFFDSFRNFKIFKEFVRLLPRRFFRIARPYRGLSGVEVLAVFLRKSLLTVV